MQVNTSNVSHMKQYFTADRHNVPEVSQHVTDILICEQNMIFQL